MTTRLTEIPTGVINGHDVATVAGRAIPLP